MGSLLSEDCQAVKGTVDLLPQEVKLWEFLEQNIFKVVNSYGYQPIRLPLIEKTALFKRSIGEVTDIIEKEMFSFFDEKNRNLSLRPEGTAGCVRAAIQHSLLRTLPQKLWYLGPMFRYEAPQKGRNRQFYQFGIECFGVSNYVVELEQILLVNRLFNNLGLNNSINLEINTLGSLNARKIYKLALIEYLNNYQHHLDPDSLRRLHTNPLRILDTKDPTTRKILLDAPKFFDYLDPDSLDNYNALKHNLINLGINFTENPNIVRGLDYYTGIVWEWTTDLLGSQNAVAAGGRYDHLVSDLCGEQVPAVGLAIGLDRIILLLSQFMDPPANKVDLYVMANGVKANAAKFKIVEQIRDHWPNLNIELDLLGGSFKNQFKRANRIGARIAIVLGDQEIETNKITIKYLTELDQNSNNYDNISPGYNNEPERQFSISIEQLSNFL